MTAPTGGGETTPAAVLRETPSPEDSGAEKADRYQSQAMMATGDVLSLYFTSLDRAGNLVSGADFTVTCEHHERRWRAVLGGSETTAYEC